MAHAHLSPWREQTAVGKPVIVAGLGAQAQPAQAGRHRREQSSVPLGVKLRQRGLALQPQAGRLAGQDEAADAHQAGVQRRPAGSGIPHDFVGDGDFPTGVTDGRPYVQVG